MEATKRFSTTKVVSYSMSNTATVVSFGTLQEAIDHVMKENELHPRSRKVNNYITDKNQKKSDLLYARENAYYLKGCIERNELPESWR